MGNDLHLTLQRIRNRIWLILLVILIVCGLTATYAYYFVKPIYEASTRILVNNKSDVSLKPLDYSQLNANIQLIETYKEIIKSSKVMDRVVEQHPELNLDVLDLLSNVNVSSIANTQVMIISATDGSYDKAVKMANAVSQELQILIPSLMNVDNVSILDKAGSTMAATNVSTDPVLILLLGFVLSIMIAAGMVFILESVDDTFKAEEEIQDLLGIPLLGTIHTIKKRYLKSVSARARSGRVAETKYAGVN